MPSVAVQLTNSYPSLAVAVMLAEEVNLPMLVELIFTVPKFALFAFMEIGYVFSEKLAVTVPSDVAVIVVEALLGLLIVMFPLVTFQLSNL